MSLATTKSRRVTTSAARRSTMRSLSRPNAVPSRRSTRRSLAVSVRSSGTSSRQVEGCDDPCCQCGPNFYQKVFGPTADETILVGLQTFIGLCEQCPPEQESEPIVEEEESEEDVTPRRLTCLDIKDMPSCNDSPSGSSQTDPDEIQHCGSQTEDLRITNGSQTIRCTLSTCAQTNTPCLTSSGSQAKYFSCEAAQKCMPCPKCCRSQTDKCTCTTPIPIPPCCHCPTVSKSIQYSKSRSRSTRGSSVKASSDSCCCCIGTESEETPGSCCCSTIPPRRKSIKSFRKSSLKASSLCSCCRTAQETFTTSTRRCSCSTESKPQRQVTLCCDCQASTSCACEDSVDVDNGMEMGDSNEVTVRYAITKISKFFTYTTFEVMKSTSKKPKVMPRTLEGVFVMKNCSCKE